MNKISKNKKAFSIIEVLISVLIFSLGISSVYMLISSSLKANTYNENHIIAANLAREQIELIRNIRDSNYSTFNLWNKISPKITNYSDPKTFFKTGHIYKIENDFSSSANFPIKTDDITTIFGEGKNEINGLMGNYKLCINSEGIYTYNCSGNSETKFYRFIKIDEVKDNSGVIQNAFKISSVVIWTIGGYNKINIDTIITDWKIL